MAGHGCPWPAMAGHGWPWLAIAGHCWPGHDRPWPTMAGRGWSFLVNGRSMVSQRPSEHSLCILMLDARKFDQKIRLWSMALVNGSGQWLWSTALANGSGQWLWSMALVNSRSQNPKYLSSKIPQNMFPAKFSKTFCRSWPWPAQAGKSMVSQGRPLVKAQDS